MAKVTINQYQTRQFGGAPPYGNVTTLLFGLTTTAAGAAINADSTAALADGDVVDLGLLPEGMRLDDLSLFVATAMTATVTGSVGFVYEDGVDDAAAPQDPAYFGSAIDLATTGRKRATGGKLVTLPKPARLILTIGGADNAKASDIKALISGELTGNR